MSRDFQVGRVYGAENTLAWMYDNVDHGSITITGIPIQLEPEAKFGTLEGIQAYVDRVLAMPSVVAAFGTREGVKVRERRGQAAAHYQSGTVAVNTTGTRWAMRELVILHELAHHFALGDGHGSEFSSTLVTLTGLVMGPQVSLALKILYDTQGVK
jgi:putative metallohydrolase (TIGR04338 family)